MNQQTFLQVLLPIKDKMFRLAKRMLISTEEAEDALQETYLKMWNNQANYTHLKNMEAYAITMTKNYCLDRLKSKQAQLQNIDNHFNTKYDTVNSENYELSEGKKLINHYIESLPETQKIIIQLRDIEGYEFDEISEILQMNPTAIRVNLSRARKWIKEQLLADYQYDKTLNH